MTGRVWLADLLGPLRHLGACARCGLQFMSVNVYVYRAGSRLVCERCSRRELDHAS